MSLRPRIKGPITVDGNVIINGSVDFDQVTVPANGSILSSSDFYRLQGGAALPTGSAIQITSNGWAGWLFPDAVTSGVAFAQSFPSNWLTATLSWGYVPLTNVGGNIRWQVTIRRVNALGVGGQLISDPPQTTAPLTQAVGTFLSMGHVFTTPATFDLHNAGAFFGEVVSIGIERLGGDAADTYTLGDIMLTNFSVNRLT